MKIWAALADPRLPLCDVPALARRAEHIGFHGLLIPEAVHDGFLTALLALEHTRTLEVATSVVLAFPRSPTSVAYAAWDLQSLSGGRFVLGLGSQVKANLVGRFGVAWTPPVARMRDYVGALRAVWQTWQEGTRLAFESIHYRLDRMQPYFNPGPIEHPRIPVALGAVGPAMTRLAGELADGLMTHPTSSSPRQLREATLPALEAGAARAGRSVTNVAILASTFVATGPDAAAVAAERERLRQELAFLYSTPQYWPALELHGRGELGRLLHARSREGRWTELPGLLDDALLDELVPSGPFEEIAARLRDRYAPLVAGITLRLPADPRSDVRLAALVRTLAEA